MSRVRDLSKKGRKSDEVGTRSVLLSRGVYRSRIMGLESTLSSMINRLELYPSNMT